MALSSSPGQWALLGDRIEKSLEDVLNDINPPPRAHTAPPPAGVNLRDDLGIDAFDSGHMDIRLDQAYAEFYMEQISRSTNLNLPAPLDTTTLFSKFARQIINDHVHGRPIPTLSPNPQVQQMFESLVQEFHRPGSGLSSKFQDPGFQSAPTNGFVSAAQFVDDGSPMHGVQQMRALEAAKTLTLPHNALPVAHEVSLTPHDLLPLSAPPQQQPAYPPHARDGQRSSSEQMHLRHAPQGVHLDTPPSAAILSLPPSMQPAALSPRTQGASYGQSHLPGHQQQQHPANGLMNGLASHEPAPHQRPQPMHHAAHHPAQHAQQAPRGAGVHMAPPLPMAQLPGVGVGGSMMQPSPHAHMQQHPGLHAHQLATSMPPAMSHGGPIHGVAAPVSIPPHTAPLPGAPPVHVPPPPPMTSLPMNPAFHAAFQAAFQAAWMAQAQHPGGMLYPTMPPPPPQAMSYPGAHAAPPGAVMNGAHYPGVPGGARHHSYPPSVDPMHPRVGPQGVKPGKAPKPSDGRNGRSPRDNGVYDDAGSRARERGAHEDAVTMDGRGPRFDAAAGGREKADDKGHARKDKRLARPIAGGVDARVMVGVKDGQGSCKSVVDELVDSGAPVAELKGKIMLMTREQHGCRYLQKQIDDGGDEALQLIFEEILEHVAALMTDPFGNYLVQKVLEACSAPQRMQLLNQIAASDLVAVALNTHGTRAVQKLIEQVSGPDEVAILTSVLKPRVVELIKDLNGNHVVQRCLQKLNSHDTGFIYEAACGNCLDIAQHRHGCCVLQRCIDYATMDQKTRLVTCIAKHGLELSNNAFGNYVIQYILDAGTTSAAEEILQQLQGSFAALSCQKFSSNVVEKCLKLTAVGLEAWRGVIVEEFIAHPDLAALLKDQFGNYVVQSALRVTNGDLHTRLVAAIRPHVGALRSMPHGKRILQQVQGKP